MQPILYDSLTTPGVVPSDYGVGVLTDCLSCKVTEQRNGSYELVMEYASEGIHSEYIVPNALIKVKPNFTDDPQLFRIYKVGKTINGRINVNAQHISYDLSGLVISSGTAADIQDAITLLNTKSGDFTITSDKNDMGTFTITEPSSVRSWFGGKEGSLLDVYNGGEWYYDNFDAELFAFRGTNRGVTIRYGKNLTELSQVLDLTNIVTDIIPYCKAQDGTVTTGTKFDLPVLLTDYKKEVAIDFTNDIDFESATPITDQLDNAVMAYFMRDPSRLYELKNSITLDFVQLKELTERIDLCDSVSIYFEPLGISVYAQCIETVWDALEERYVSTTFGTPKTNIADTLVETQREVANKPSETSMSQAIKQATELITGNLGGYVILHDSNGDGQPDEILIMNTADISTATKVWRWNASGLGYSSTGYAGPYGLAMTANGEIVADFITTGILNADIIKAGIISDLQGNSSIDMTNGSAKMKDFNAVDSLNLLDSSDNVRATIKYTPADGGAFMIYDNSGNLLGVFEAHPVQGSMLVLKEPNGVEGLRSGGGGIGGGWFETKNYNDERMFLVDGTANGNGVMELWDRSGANESAFRMIDKDGNHDVVMQVTSGGGRVDVNDGGYIFGSLRVYNSGGVLDLYDSQYLNIQCLGRTGNITCVSLTQTSSRKVKENIKPMEDFKKILELEPVSFDFINKNRGTNKRGFIAEDVAKILPNLVTPESEKLPASLDYLGMIPYLQAVIKDQEKRIEALEKKVNGK